MIKTRSVGGSSRNNELGYNNGAADTSSAYLQEATQSVVISRSSFDQATPILVTSAKTTKTDIGRDAIVAECDVKNYETAMEVIQSNVFVWGDNTHGQLAIQAAIVSQIVDPVAINIHNILQVACGAAHTVFLTSNGIFSMGDNSQGQLGLSPSEVRGQRQPTAIKLFGTTEVHCSDYASFALVRVKSMTKNDEIYSWGGATQQHAVLGRFSEQKSAHRPGMIKFVKKQEPFKVKTMSVGSNHAAVVTNDHQVHVWGENKHGQLGLDHTEACETPVLNTLVASDIFQTAKVTCGKSFSFLISGHNEIMITGRLPFTVESEQGQELDYIVNFQSIAQFDQRARILQVEASRFASLVVDPCEDGQPKELFFWGQSPLGVFNELTPLNQLFAGSCEQQSSNQPEDASQQFNVKAVRNGLNFCVFVDQDSGMTYQIGAEHMIDPYIDDALVSLSELRDAQFDDATKFACGANFVIGESLTSGHVLFQSPSPEQLNTKYRTCDENPQVNAFSTVEEDLKEEEALSLQPISPAAGSKQSQPRRAIYQGSSMSPMPFTPANQSELSCSGSAYTTSMKLQHKELIGTLKNLTGCMPMTMTQEVDQFNLKAKIDSARGETRIKPAKNTNTMTISEKEREFNKTGGVPRTANGAKFLISDEIFNHDNMTECGSVAQIAAEILADCTKSNSTNQRAIKQNQVDENPEINNSNNYDSQLLTRVDVAGDDKQCNKCH